VAEVSASAEPPERFGRRISATEREWQRLLIQALDGWPARHEHTLVDIDLTIDGQPPASLRISWYAEPEQVIGGVRLPQIVVHFSFQHAAPALRARVMKHLDLHLQRGGG